MSERTSKCHEPTTEISDPHTQLSFKHSEHLRSEQRGPDTETFHPQGGESPALQFRGEERGPCLPWGNVKKEGDWTPSGVSARGGRGRPPLGMQESPAEEEYCGQATQTLWWLKDGWAEQLRKRPHKVLKDGGCSPQGGPAEVKGEGRMDGGSHHRATPLRPRPPSAVSLFRRKSRFLMGFSSRPPRPAPNSPLETGILENDDG